MSSQERGASHKKADSRSGCVIVLLLASAALRKVVLELPKHCCHGQEERPYRRWSDKTAANQCESSETSRLRYMPQKRPTRLPTTVRLGRGTKVKLNSDTSGQSFKPDRAIGQKSCQLSVENVVDGWAKHTRRQSRKIAFPSLPLNAPITEMKSNVFTVAANVWSSMNFLAVFVLCSVFCPSLPIVYPGNCSSRNSCHR
jgi:hypothetical protein